MIRSLGQWLEHRTGIGSLLHYALYERVPGGARWRYVWGSTLAFAFMVQVVTGIFLWAAYSPSTTTAWGSVYAIQYQMDFGWLLRGVHHFMAQAMVVLLAIHLLQVIWDGAYRAPREVNFWIGLILMQIVLALSLTGYLLPWDQKGYWATRVATNLIGITPVVGKEVQELVVGGPDYSHATLTRFFALHAGVLPGLLIFFLVVHLAVFRRHGLCAKLPLRGNDAPFWPDQVLKDAVACLAIAAIVGALAWYFRAELTAPADGARQYSAARPEWYFLFLFQFLKLFHGETGELMGAIVIPGLIVLVLFAMPLIARIKAGEKPVGHYFNLGFLGLLFVGIIYLTIAALQEDGNNRELANARWMAEQEAMIAKSLAMPNVEGQGIPSSGPRDMMREHPKAVAVRVIMDQCLKCHNFRSADGEGFDNPTPTAPNLWGYGQAEWVEGLLDPARTSGPEYFGNTNMKDGEMAGYVHGNIEGGKDVGDSEPVYTKEDLRKIALALQGEARIKTYDGDKGENLLAVEGDRLIRKGCTDCHQFRGAGEGNTYAPNLNGWASHEWIRDFLKNPNDERFYGHLGENQAMPAFGLEANPEGGYSDEVLDYIAQFIRGKMFIRQGRD